MGKARAGVPNHGLSSFLRITRPSEHREPMLGMQEVADAVGIHKVTLSRMVTAGTFPMPALYSGRCGKAYWPKSVIDRYLKEKKRGNSSGSDA